MEEILLDIIKYQNQLDNVYKYIEEGDEDDTYPVEVPLTEQDKINLQNNLKKQFKNMANKENAITTMWHSYYEALINKIDISKFKIDEAYDVNYFNDRFQTDYNNISDSNIDFLTDALRKILDLRLPFVAVDDLINLFKLKLEIIKIDK